MTQPLAIRAQDLRFTYAGRPVPAIRDVSFELDAGECLLVVGASGSGKSTLALALAGLVPHEVPGEFAGALEIGGIEVATSHRGAVAAMVGVVFQDPASQLVMDRVADDVAFGLESRGWTLAAMARRVPEALAENGLTGYERRRPNRLSGGEQQRVALAGVLAARPGILVLDEPTANLDPTGTAAFFAGLAAIRAARSQTIVLVEHRVDRAWPLADRVLALRADGSPLDFGSRTAVLRRSRKAMTDAGIWLPAATARGRSRPKAGAAVGAEGIAAGPVAASTGARAGSVIRVGNALAGRGGAVVRARGMRFGYERGAAAEPIIRGVDLELAAGERVALVGSNGSGKSTLGRLLVGLLRPDRGTVRIGDVDPARIAPGRLSHLAGYVFQDPERQFLATRVGDEIALGLDRAEIDAATELMERLRLPLGAFADRSPYQLSGGEQRRLSLACALVREPGFLVLDEPTFGQDRHGYRGLLEILDDRAVAGTTVLAATHDERFVADFAGRQIVLEEGWIIGQERVDGASPDQVPGGVAAEAARSAATTWRRGS